MHLSDPLRPILASGHPALLIDGSAIPRFSVLPLDETHTELVIMLRAYDAAHGFTYGQHRYVCETRYVGTIMDRYFLNPEGLLEDLFGWKPQVPSGRASTPQAQRRPMSAATEEELTAQLDLI